MTKSKAYQVRQVFELKGLDPDDEENREEWERLHAMKLVDLLQMIQDLRSDFCTSFMVLR
jgi:hypothetical protein